MGVVGIGVDIVDVERFRARVHRGEGFLDRIFTADEQLYCQTHARPMVHYAARFAAKEAFLKALGVGIEAGISLLEVEIARPHNGPPVFRLGPDATSAMEVRGCSRSFLSLSHARCVAIAFVVLE
jgi:holo-[acyl-carrier protein] synthase